MRTVAIAFACLAASVGFSQGTASAATAPTHTMTAHLSISGVVPNTAGQRRVVVKGVVSMSRSVAQNRIDRGATIRVDLYGDDEGRNDELRETNLRPIQYWAADDGFHYQVIDFSGSPVLNEDNPLFGDGTDELYAVAQWVAGPTPPAFGSAKSNVVTGNF